MQTQTKYVFHFPNGNVIPSIDMTYCFSQINIGEKIIIEGDPIVYKVSDIQNQFRNESIPDWPKLKMIMRNVILTKYEKIPTFSPGR